jgi:hypothetical protein
VCSRERSGWGAAHEEGKKSGAQGHEISKRAGEGASQSFKVGANFRFKD